MCTQTTRMRECSPQVEAKGLDMLGSDVSRRWGPREQDRQVGAAHILLRADVCEELGKASLRIQPRREEQGAGAVMIFHGAPDMHNVSAGRQTPFGSILRQELYCAEGPRGEEQRHRSTT